MRRATWSGQRVLILGAARQGTALAQYLVQHGAQVILNDRQPAEKLVEAMAALQNLGGAMRWVCGGHPLELLDEADLVCVSGGVPQTNPIVAAARERNIPLSNDSQIFLEAAPCKVIGITGSAGKTTTTTLVGRMAEAALPTVYVGGNIGSPLIPLVDGMEADDLAVMELSSFQLEIMTRSPQIGAVLNVTANHLDRHGTMHAYLNAKKRILDFQGEEDVAVLGQDDPGAWGLASNVHGGLVSFGMQKPEASRGVYLRDEAVYYREDGVDTWLLDRSDVTLRGDHNLLNVMAAGAIAKAAGLPDDSIRAGVTGFKGVAHRLEFVRSWGGADWYNDSIATAPERAMAAIRSFDEPLVLLAGGRDKDLPWDAFAELVRQRVDHLIVFGEAAGKILDAMGPGYPAVRCSHLREAVQEAAHRVEPGDVVLLSPGGTSFDEFKDFEERGECFRQLVMSL